MIRIQKSEDGSFKFVDDTPGLPLGGIVGSYKSADMMAVHMASAIQDRRMLRNVLQKIAETEADTEARQLARAALTVEWTRIPVDSEP